MAPVHRADCRADGEWAGGSRRGRVSVGVGVGVGGVGVGWAHEGIRLCVAASVDCKSLILKNGHFYRLQPINPATPYWA